jgi:hypothetical protein
MTDLLEKAFQEAEKLPESEQDTLAKWLLEEMASERRWDDAFSASPDRLKDLANEALEEYRRGRTEPLEPNKL